VAVAGFALLGLMVTPVRKQVFLLVITVITNVMHSMTPTAIMVQKAAVGRSKSPPLAVKKQLLVVLLFNSPQGARMPTWCGSHSGCVGWMEHESRLILNLRRCSIYLIIYVSLCMGGGAMVCSCKVQVVKDIVEDMLLWDLSCLSMSGS